METLSIFVHNHIFMFILFFLLPLFIYFIFLSLHGNFGVFSFVMVLFFTMFFVIFVSYSCPCNIQFQFVGLLHFLCEGVWCLSSIDLNLYTIDSFYFHCLHTNLDKLCYRNFHICFVVVGYDVNNCVFYV